MIKGLSISEDLQSLSMSFLHTAVVYIQGRVNILQYKAMTWLHDWSAAKIKLIQGSTNVSPLRHVLYIYILYNLTWPDFTCETNQRRKDQTWKEVKKTPTVPEWCTRKVFKMRVKRSPFLFCLKSCTLCGRFMLCIQSRLTLLDWWLLGNRRRTK